MPLTAIQQSVAEVLRIFRSKRSYVANGAAAVMPVRDISCIPVFGEN